MKQRSLAWFLVIWMVQVSCTEKESVRKPQVDKYRADTALMIQVASKFINDPDIKKAHDAAVATQLTRAMSCTDFNGECTMYGSLISHIIDATADGSMSPEEKKALMGELDDLKKVTAEGLHKLN